MNTTNDAPRCVGIIMDGNRRWATREGLPKLEGHRKGYYKVKETAAWAVEAGIEHLVCYAFSTENWKRTEEEVGYLMKLLETMLLADAEEMLGKGYRLRVVGQRERLSKSLQEGIQKIEEKSVSNTTLHLTLAISYGGRADITQAANTLLQEKKQEITEDDIKAHLWTHDVPDPDIIIRTSGEQRLSNFLTWESVYSELFFIDKHWPEFSKEDFLGIVEEYKNRDRRKGK